eukprot:gene11629-24354_t
MGNNSSSSVDSKISESPNIVPDGYFGVRVSGAALKDVVGNERTIMEADINKALEEAYTKGKQEATSLFQGEIAKVASNVYENVQDQLNTMQETQAAASKKLTETLKAKLTPLPVTEPCCQTEKTTLLQCYKDHPSSPLTCATQSDAFASCVDAAVQ